MIRFLIGLVLGIIIGASMAGKLPDIRYNISDDLIKDSTKELILEGIDR